MFSFLKKSGTSIHTDNVWKTRQACLKGMMTESMKAISQSGKPMIISWFDDRHQSLTGFLNQLKVPRILMDEYFACEKISNAVSSEIRTNNEGEWFMKNAKRS
jgi:hypothetical protein